MSNAEDFIAPAATGLGTAFAIDRMEKAGYFSGPLRPAFFWFNLASLLWCFIFPPFYTTGGINWMFAVGWIFAIGQWTLGLLAFSQTFYNHPSRIIRWPVRVWAAVVRTLLGITIGLFIMGVVNSLLAPRQQL